MPENQDRKRQDSLRVSDFGAGHGRPPEDTKVAGLMYWVRLILPMVIAAFGWYVGHIIGNFDEDVRKLEDKVQQQEVQCTSRTGEIAIQIAELRKRIEENASSDRLAKQEVISKDEYLRNLAELRRRILELERKSHSNEQ